MVGESLHLSVVPGHTSGSKQSCGAVAIANRDWNRYWKNTHTHTSHVFGTTTGGFPWNWISDLNTDDVDDNAVTIRHMSLIRHPPAGNEQQEQNKARTKQEQ